MLVALAIAPGGVFASDTLEEVVVTAQKRDQKLQDVAMSISAASGRELEELGVRRAIDIVNVIPGIQVSGGGGGTINAFNIRGVTQNAFAPNLESPIAVYQDETYISVNSGVDLSMFDIERVEVLRGPQGTLFGRNATGGVVRYVTARPSREFEGGVQLELGEDGRVRGEAAVGGPLSDRFAYRLAAAANRDDGLIKNRIGPNAMRANDWAVRGQLAYEGETVNALFKAQFIDEDSNRGGYSHVVARNGEYVTDPNETDFFGFREPDDNPFTASLDFPAWNRNRMVDLNATVDFPVGNATVTSVTSYQDFSNDYSEDSDVSPNDVYNYVRGSDLQQISQELRASWDGERATTVLGLYYLRIDGTYFTRQFGELFFGDLTEIADVDQVTSSYAIFGQTEIHFAEKASVEIGLRYSKDDKDFDYSANNVFDIYQPGPQNFVSDFTDDGVSARLQLNYRPRAEQLWYIGVNRGIKSGGINFPLFPQNPEYMPFDGEVLTSIEGGVRTSVGERSTLNVSAFYYDYDDFQAFSFDGLATRVVNVNATMHGGEVEFRTSPVSGLDLSLGASYLDNEVTDVPLAVSSGTEKSPYAPKWTVNGMARYSWSVLSGSTLSAQVDGSWRDEQTFNLVPTPVLIEPAYAIFNARIDYSSPGDRWGVSLFVRNLTDEEFRFYSFDTSPDWGALEDVPGVQRWYGGSVSFRW